MEFGGDWQGGNGVSLWFCRVLRWWIGDTTVWGWGIFGLTKTGDEAGESVGERVSFGIFVGYVEGTLFRDLRVKLV